MLPLPYLEEEWPSLLFEPPRPQGKTPLAPILVRWSHPSDFLTFHCRRSFAPASAASPAASVAVAAASFVADASVAAASVAAPRPGVAAFSHVAAAVIKLVAVAGSQLSCFQTVKVCRIVIMKVVAGFVTEREDAVEAGQIQTSVPTQMRDFDRGLRTACPDPILPRLDFDS